MLLTAVGAVSGVAPGRADTLERALVQAYQNNPSLNAQRAALRATDENVPQALSGYQPKLSVSAAGGYNYFCEVNKAANHRQSAGCRCSDWGLTHDLRSTGTLSAGPRRLDRRSDPRR